MIYILADDYQIAKNYADAADIPPSQYRFVSRPEVLRGVDRPDVVAVGECSMVSDAILDSIARKGVEVRYA